jgi:external thioesterase TEII
MKIIIFTFAGGNKYSFNFLKKDALFDSNMIVLEYPGRGNRISESLLDNIDQIVDDCFSRLVNEIDAQDYLIYGHSMGGLIGYLVCKKIQNHNVALPVKLVVSGVNAPSVERKKNISSLSDFLFWDEVCKMGGVPVEFLDNDELINFYTPILKADFKAIEEYKYVNESKLDVPIDVFYGVDENIFDYEIQNWQEETNREVVIKRVKGGHFFIYKNVNLLLDSFSLT